jgi:hypothetical protein
MGIFKAVVEEAGTGVPPLLGGIAEVLLPAYETPQRVHFALGDGVTSRS